MRGVAVHTNNLCSRSCSLIKVRHRGLLSSDASRAQCGLLMLQSSRTPCRYASTAALLTWNDLLGGQESLPAVLRRSPDWTCTGKQLQPGPQTLHSRARQPVCKAQRDLVEQELIVKRTLIIPAHSVGFKTQTWDLRLGENGRLLGVNH